MAAEVFNFHQIVVIAEVETVLNAEEVPWDQRKDSVDTL